MWTPAGTQGCTNSADVTFIVQVTIQTDNLRETVRIGLLEFGRIEDLL
jgi:hypothetical protein